MPKDPSYMDLKNYTVAPCREFLFGTDTMGRDIFSMIWYGGRQSLFIGFVATMIINQYCDYLWNCQWSGSGMAGHVTHENDRDFAEHSQSASGYFLQAILGERQMC